MTKEGWRAWTLFTGAAFIISNAAWFYTGRVDAIADYGRGKGVAPIRDDVVPQTVYAPPLVLPDQGVIKPLKPGQRCIQHERIERIANGWVSVDDPC
jgi:hypothetical protein